MKSKFGSALVALSFSASAATALGFDSAPLNHSDQNCLNECLQDCGAACPGGPEKPICIKACGKENLECRVKCNSGGTDPPPDACDVPPPVDTSVSDPLLSFGWKLGGLSLNVIAGPRSCGGTRVGRSVATADGDGTCSVVEDGGFFWANDLCARNQSLVVGNSSILEACQEFSSGGSDLGENDCRYIVHAGTPSESIKGMTCQPAHVVRVPGSCP